MAELPPRPRLLAVQVNVRSGNREQALVRRDSSDEVDHDAPAARLGRAERETEDRAQVILELARLGAVDRPVPGVVHARSELVRQELPAGVEELDREHADVAELVEETRRDLLRLTLWRSPARARETRRGSRRGARSRRADRRRSRPSRPVPPRSTARARTRRFPPPARPLRATLRAATMRWPLPS